MRPAPVLGAGHHTTRAPMREHERERGRAERKRLRAPRLRVRDRTPLPLPRLVTRGLKNPGQKKPRVGSWGLSALLFAGVSGSQSGMHDRERGHRQGPAG